MSFVLVTLHKGEYTVNALEMCLLEWGIKNVFTVTVDNVSSNDTALTFFKKKMMSWGERIVRIKYVHMRYIAHILNLIVHNRLKDVSISIQKLREAVRHIRNLLARLRKFK